MSAYLSVVLGLFQSYIRYMCNKFLAVMSSSRSDDVTDCVCLCVCVKSICLVWSIQSIWSQMLQGCLKSVSRVSQGCLKGVSRVSQGCPSRVDLRNGKSVSVTLFLPCLALLRRLTNHFSNPLRRLTNHFSDPLQRLTNHFSDPLRWLTNLFSGPTSLICSD